MPYRKAWIWVLALLALTFVAFWPGYFSKLPVKKLAHHYHAAPHGRGERAANILA